MTAFLYLRNGRNDNHYAHPLDLFVHLDMSAKKVLHDRTFMHKKVSSTSPQRRLVLPCHNCVSNMTKKNLTAAAAKTFKRGHGDRIGRLWQGDDQCLAPAGSHNPDAEQQLCPRVVCGRNGGSQGPQAAKRGAAPGP